jgi:hypothetical protein
VKGGLAYTYSSCLSIRINDVEVIDIHEISSAADSEGLLLEALSVPAMLL